ncbi:MAG: alanine racemase [Lacisediminihabitans sp.]
MQPTPGSSRRREAFVDTRVVADNVVALRAAAGVPTTLAVVTGDAFGHGAVPIAQAAVAAGASWLVVGDTAEGVTLREHGITVPILTWQHAAGDDFALVARHGLVPALSSVELCRRAIAAGVRELHLVPEIGGEQLGIPADAWPALCAELAAAERAGALLVSGVMASLRGYEVDTAARLTEALATARDAGLDPTVVHVAEYEPGRGLERYPATAVRLAAAMYGLSAYPKGCTLVRQALTLTAPVVGVKQAPAGAGVSYGYTYVTKRSTTLALVPLGYGDGLPRRSGNITRVGLDGRSLPVIGRIAMDALVVDTETTGGTAVGAVAQVIGTANSGAWSAEEWATALGTTSLDIVARIGQRVSRVVT